MPFCIGSKFAQNHCVSKDFLNSLKIRKSRLLRHPWGIKNFDEIPLSCTVKEIETNLCFCIFGKNSKIQNGRHFWREEFFFFEN